MSFRNLYFIPVFFILTFFFSLLALVVALFDPDGHLSHRVAFLWATTTLKLSGVRVKMMNAERIKKDQAYIFAANHQSAFDILALFSQLRFRFLWLAKESLFNIPIFGWAMKRSGYIPINRSNPKQAYQSLIQAAEKVREGTSIIIFPEGTRREKEGLGEFKKGGFILAIKSQRPIVPVGIIGSAGIKPKKGLLIRPGEIRVVLGDPIPTEGRKAKEAEGLMEMVRGEIERLKAGKKG